ncbi:MAG: hypothetical protein ACI8PV_001721 [Dinoroseobacter sp.]|jgi:hypothetical protein
MKTESIPKIDVVGDDLMIATQDPIGIFTEGHAYAKKINGFGTQIARLKCQAL